MMVRTLLDVWLMMFVFVFVCGIGEGGYTLRGLPWQLQSLQIRDVAARKLGDEYKSVNGCGGMWLTT